jgi:hypothetical protein
MARPALVVADIFRDHGPPWRRANAGHLSLGQLKVMSAIESCRTAALGGHVARCEKCARTHIVYNSCRNRHCPWLDKLTMRVLGRGRASPSRGGTTGSRGATATRQSRWRLRRRQQRADHPHQSRRCTGSVASVPVRNTIGSAQIAMDRSAPSVPYLPAGSFLGGLRTPAHERTAMIVTGRHPQPFTKADIASHRTGYRTCRDVWSR